MTCHRGEATVDAGQHGVGRPTRIEELADSHRRRQGELSWPRPWSATTRWSRSRRRRRSSTRRPTSCIRRSRSRRSTPPRWSVALLAVRGRPEGEHRPGRGDGRRAQAHRRPVRHRQHLGRPVRRRLPHQHGRATPTAAASPGATCWARPWLRARPPRPHKLSATIPPLPRKGLRLPEPFPLLLCPPSLPGIKAEGAFPDFAGSCRELVRIGNAAARGGILQ